MVGIAGMYALAVDAMNAAMNRKMALMLLRVVGIVVLLSVIVFLLLVVSRRLSAMLPFEGLAALVGTAMLDLIVDISPQAFLLFSML